ncbi:MAG: ABC transporter ATP-binding protein [Rhizobiaceae bacterium]
MSTRLAVSDLTVRYPNALAPALANVRFELAAGERLAIIGESGSGKSTLALAIAGLLPRGTQVLGSVEWPELGRSALPGRDYGFVFQDPAASLDPVMPVGRQVAEVVEALTHWQAGKAARDILLRVGLPESAASAYPHQLSGGQKQRVGIAAAIVARPQLLIADEATSALDTIVQASIVRLIGELVAETGMSLIFISHDIALASGIADRIAVFRNGQLVEIGNTADIVNRPRDPYTRLLLEAAETPYVAGGRG